MSETLTGRDWFGFALRWAAALVVAIAIQVGTNLVNDAADFKRGADPSDRLGPPRAVAMGLLEGRRAMTGGLACLALAGVVGLMLVAVSSWWLLVPGGIALLAGIAYTEGPRPLAYLGLGEIFVLLFFGLFAVGGTALVAFLPAVPQVASSAGSLFVQTLWFGVPIGLLAVGILEVNNIRDASTDREVGKATLAVRIGDRGARSLFVAALVTAIIVLAVPMTVFAFEGGLVAAIGAGILAVVFLACAIPPVRAVRSGTSGRALNSVLGQVARCEGSVAVVFAIGLVAWELTS